MSVRTIFVVLALASIAATFVQGAEQLPDDIDSWLRSYTASTSTAVPRPVPYNADVTAMAEGTVSAEPATAVLFTLEGVRGGTDYLQYLGLFWNRRGHHVFCCVAQVGGKGIGDVDSIKMVGGLIRLGGFLFVEGVDAMCCPSKPYVADLSLIHI